MFSSCTEIITNVEPLNAHMPPVPCARARERGRQRVEAGAPSATCPRGWHTGHTTTPRARIQPRRRHAVCVRGRARAHLFADDLLAGLALDEHELVAADEDATVLQAVRVGEACDERLGLLWGDLREKASTRAARGRRRAEARRRVRRRARPARARRAHHGRAQRGHARRCRAPGRRAGLRPPMRARLPERLGRRPEHARTEKPGVDAHTSALAVPMIAAFVTVPEATRWSST